MREPFSGPGHSEAAVEVARRSSGRFRFVIAREADGAGWLHVQPAPAITSMSRRFRESHALRVMGFTPVRASRFFPGACTFAGCYSREIHLPSESDGVDEAAARIASRLENAVDELIELAAELEPLGIDLAVPD
ncbi:MAG: hypothetical protein OXF96_03740 [Chloroflexi bacterium]|nr:hypothetical protein [Chloroflexota bacterium]